MTHQAHSIYPVGEQCPHNWTPSCLCRYLFPPCSGYGWETSAPENKHPFHTVLPFTHCFALVTFMGLGQIVFEPDFNNDIPVAYSQNTLVYYYVLGFTGSNTG